MKAGFCADICKPQTNPLKKANFYGFIGIMKTYSTINRQQRSAVLFETAMVGILSPSNGTKALTAFVAGTEKTG
jgi:hypothetical protein